MTITHGVDVAQLGQAAESITEEPEGGQFRFPTETERTDGLPYVTTATGKEVNNS